MDGFGYHEVIIETPEHDRILPCMREDELVDVLLTYRQRYQTLRADPRVKLVLLFKNHGERAGTSIVHPHSQVIGTPVIPFHIRRKYEIAVQHYDDTGRCLYCDIDHL
jgi:UDPglucose--hexose-1-phosphate uridylyltransferase